MRGRGDISGSENTHEIVDRCIMYRYSDNDISESHNYNNRTGQTKKELHFILNQKLFARRSVV